MTTFDTRNGHVTIDTATHKAVPKDAIVLDLDEIASHLSGSDRVSQTLYALRASHAEERPADFTTNLKIAAAIEAQTKPARIPEPGWGGQVEASVDHSVRKERRRFVHAYDQPDIGSVWTDDKGFHAAWTDLINPVLIREGVES